MGKSVLGVLLGLLAAALAWILRGGKPGLDRARIHKRYITLRVKKGVCAIERPPDDVVLRQGAGDQVHWIITNPESEIGTPCHRSVQVCVGRWTLNGEGTEPPVDDRDNGQYCRTVKPGQTKRLPAQAKSRAPLGDYHYEIEIDGQVAVDPIVRLVL